MRLEQKKMPLYLRIKFYHEQMCLKVKLKDASIFSKIKGILTIIPRKESRINVSKPV